MRIQPRLESETDLAARDRVQDALAVGIVAAHDRDGVGPSAARKYLGEQSQLGREIVLDCPVIVEMVAAEVGEQAGAKVQMIGAPFRNSDRRDFRRRHPHALALHLAQRRLDIERLRRGEAAVHLAPADKGSDRADNSGGTARGLEHRLQQVGGGGFSAGAGNPDQIDSLARRPEKARGGRALRTMVTAGRAAPASPPLTTTARAPRLNASSMLARLRSGARANEKNR